MKDMRIIKLKTKYKVESQSQKGQYYFVDLEKKTCSCPEYIYRMHKIGGICKHINAVEEKHSGSKPTVITKEIMKKRQKEIVEKGKHEKELAEKEDRYQEIIGYVRTKGDVEFLELAERFDEDLVQDLLRLGELMEEDGVVRVLE